MTKLLNRVPNNSGHFYFVTSFGIRLIGNDSVNYVLMVFNSLNEVNGEATQGDQIYGKSIFRCADHAIKLFVVPFFLVKRILSAQTSLFAIFSQWLSHWVIESLLSRLTMEHLSPEDLQAIVAGVASNQELITEIVSQLKVVLQPQLSNKSSHPPATAPGDPSTRLSSIAAGSQEEHLLSSNQPTSSNQSTGDNQPWSGNQQDSPLPTQGLSISWSTWPNAGYLSTH